MRANPPLHGNVHDYLSSVRRRPSHTLFPYTTLSRSLTSFRSLPAHEGATVLVQPRHCERLKTKMMHKIARSNIQDRKSTRLNSSHVEISYAVFCLNKKKILTAAGLHAKPPLHGNSH